MKEKKKNKLNFINIMLFLIIVLVVYTIWLSRPTKKTSISIEDATKIACGYVEEEVVKEGGELSLCDLEVDRDILVVRAILLEDCYPLVMTATDAFNNTEYSIDVEFSGLYIECVSDVEAIGVFISEYDVRKWGSGEFDIGDCSSQWQLSDLDK